MEVSVVNTSQKLQNFTIMKQIELVQTKNLAEVGEDIGLSAGKQMIKAFREANPDATREQHCQMWEARTGTKVSPASISRARMAFGWTRKKRR